MDADARPALWVCPRCGARLVSRNLWHSCGQHTLDELFDGARPRVLDLARSYIHGVFTIEHFNNYPAVLVELGVIHERDLRDLLVDAWLAVAPAELAEGFDG
jgi:hypothetical protein